MKGKIEILHNDIPRNKFEFTASVNLKDYFKLEDLFAKSILNGVEIEFNPIEYKCNCANDTIDGLTYAWKILDDIKDKKVCMPPIRSSVVDDKLVNILFGRYNKPKTEIIFNEPATILYKDGKKYVSKCDKEDKFSEELGLALCLLKSFGVSYSDFEKLLKGAKRQGVKNDENGSK